MILYYRVTYHSPTEKYHENVKYDIVWDGKTLKGTYVGDFQNTQPNGEGVFSSDDGSFSYEGEWKKGLFSGKGKIDYSEGIIEEGEFLEGNRHGRIKKYLNEESFKEGTYIETVYEMNIPYARCDTYIGGELSSTDYYVNATLISEIKNEAKLLTEKMIKNEDYYNTYVYVEGEVAFVGDTAGSSYFRIDTDTVGSVYGGYDNTYGLTVDQRYMPTMKIGEKVILYGYYVGFAKDSVYTDLEGYGNRFPKITPFFAEVKDDMGVRQFSEKKPNMTYSNLLANPYIFNMEKVNDSFVVKNCIKSGINYIITVYKEGKDDELYTLIYEGDILDRFPTSTKLDIKGYINGQYKIVSTEVRNELIKEGAKSDDIITYDFTRYPVIKVYELNK